MTLHLEFDGVHVTTIGASGTYAMRYPLMKVPCARTLDVEVRYRAEAGDLTFGALSGDESRWLATAGPATDVMGCRVKTFRLMLDRNEKFVLLAANAHPMAGQPSTCVVERVGITAIPGEDVVFGSLNDDGHHPVFAQYPCPRIPVPAGASAYFIGAIVRDFLFTGQEGTNPARIVQPDYPAFDNEYFEWIAILLAARAAEGAFTMMELGAGYGRW